MGEDSWTTDIEEILENIRLNSVNYSKTHRREYFILKNKLKYFRIPIIVLSGVNSVFSVGLQPYMNQGLISVINCLLALACGIIGSVELYLKINEQMENNFLLSKDYYILSIDIFKQLNLLRENRTIDGKTYLDEKFNEYSKLIETSEYTRKTILDNLQVLNRTENEKRKDNIEIQLIDKKDTSEITINEIE